MGLLGVFFAARNYYLGANAGREELNRHQSSKRYPAVLGDAAQTLPETPAR